MTIEQKIESLIQAQWEMMSEKDLRVMFGNWMREEYKEMPENEIEIEYFELFAD